MTFLKSKGARGDSEDQGGAVDAALSKEYTAQLWGGLLCFLSDHDPGIRALGLPRPRFTSCWCCLGAP